MIKFKIEVQEYLSRTVEIEANNSDEALSKVKEQYQKEEIVLNAEDYVTTDIKCVSDE